MLIWVDAQLRPQIAPWISATFGLDAQSVRELGLRDADDEPIFMAARRSGAVVMTIDADFELLLHRFGPPPQIIWLTCGNTSNARLRALLLTALAQATSLIASGEPIVEIAG